MKKEIADMDIITTHCFEIETFEIYIASAGYSSLCCFYLYYEYVRVFSVISVFHVNIPINTYRYYYSKLWLSK